MRRAPASRDSTAQAFLPSATEILDDWRPWRRLQSGRSRKPSLCEMEFDEAAAGDLTLPAIMERCTQWPGAAVHQWQVWRSEISKAAFWRRTCRGHRLLGALMWNSTEALSTLTLCGGKQHTATTTLRLSQPGFQHVECGFSEGCTTFLASLAALVRAGPRWSVVWRTDTARRQTETPSVTASCASGLAPSPAETPTWTHSSTESSASTPAGKRPSCPCSDPAPGARTRADQAAGGCIA